MPGFHYKMTPLCATHICVAKGPYMRWWGLYQRICYALLKVALQGFIATLIYVLVTPTNKCCKVATDMIGCSNAYMCLYRQRTNYFYSSLQHLEFDYCNAYMCS
jgi:hypothetical protein